MSQYCPIPRLWATFGHQRHLLQRPFETLCEAGRLQAMQGDDAARALLTRTPATSDGFAKHLRRTAQHEDAA